MADQWHVTRDETKSGPFSSTALRRLAVSGKLLPSDQIWKEGMTKSVPASNLKGLFSDASSSAPSPSFTPNPSPPPQPISSPPPISSLPSVLNQHSGETAQPASPAPGHSFLERAKAGAADLAAKAKAAAQLASKQAEKTAQAAPTAAQSFAANMKATGQLVVKQAERTKIVQVTLTTAYFALGKSLYAAGNLRGEFPDAFKDVDDLLNATKAVDAQAAGRTTGDGLTAKAKAAGQAAMDMAQKKKLQVQSNYALSTLGKLAFEKLGEQCGSPDLIRPISDAQSRLDTLDADITRLSESKSGGVTPKRIAIGGLAFVALILLVGGLGFLSSGDSAFRQNSNGQSSKHRAASSGAKTATSSANDPANAYYKDGYAAGLEMAKACKRLARGSLSIARERAVTWRSELVQILQKAHRHQNDLIQFTTGKLQGLTAGLSDTSLLP